MNSTKIIKFLDIAEFQEILSQYRDNSVCVSPHTLFHLSTYQRNIFKETDLIRILINEKPKFIWLQRNLRIAVFFKRKNYYLKMILEKTANEITIITFLNTETSQY